MAATMLLTLDEWDLCLNSAGDWAVATEPYSIAQDAASAIKTFLGEVWYDTTLGIPYWQQILGKSPPLQLLKTQLINAALTVPDVTAAVVFIASVTGREVRGQILITFSAPSTPSAPTTNFGQAVIFFVGTNGGVLTFVGDNGGVVEFIGSGF